MSHLLIITFDDTEQAGALRQTLRQEEHEGLLSLNDAAVVVRDENGKFHVKNETDRGVAIGATGGGVLGLLIGSVFFPLAGLLIGAIGGALVGKSVDQDIDKDVIKQVQADMQPCSSALFVVVREAEPAAAMGALRPYQGNIYETSFDDETEKELRRILKTKF
jgi:uncharacterized membrane protein